MTSTHGPFNQRQLDFSTRVTCYLGGGGGGILLLQIGPSKDPLDGKFNLCIGVEGIQSPASRSGAAKDVVPLVVSLPCGLGWTLGGA